MAVIIIETSYLDSRPTTKWHNPTKNTTYDRNHYVDGGKSSFKDEDALNKAVDKNLSLYDEL